jgi:hypothetical protein
MLYVEYDWDVREDKIILDEDINIDKLGWKHGDHFELRNINGRVQLVKVEAVVKFVKGYK